MPYEPASIRTQISLTPSLYRAGKQYVSLHDISLSELIRRSLKLKLQIEIHKKTKRRHRLKKLADKVIGSVKITPSHPHWKDESSVEKWFHDIRSDWDNRGWEDPKVIKLMAGKLK